MFAYHQNVLNFYEDHFKRENIGYIRIDGKVTPKDRNKFVQDFQHNNQTRVAVLSISTCSQGLTLTAASTVVFAEIIWTPSIMLHAEDRAHRISQQNCVNVYYLYGANTVDDIIFSMIDMKSEVVANALDGKTHNYQITHKSKNEYL